MTWTHAFENTPRVLAFFNLGTAEIVIIIVFIFLLFGAKKIPELMRSLGRAQGEYLHAKKEFEREVKASSGEAVDDPMERMREKAQALGIDTKGKDFDQLQREVALEGGDTRVDTK
jgi:sec-independent protein translocase protein TatA